MVSKQPIALVVKSGAQPARLGEQLMHAWLSDKAADTMRNYRHDLEDFRAFVGTDDIAAAIGLLINAGHGEANRIALAYKADMMERPVWASTSARNAGAKPAKKGYASSTINRRLAALRSVCRLARRFGHIAWSLEVDGVTAHALRDTTGVDRQDYLRLLGCLAGEMQSDKQHVRERAIRDHAIVRLLMDHALRRAELVALTWPDDIDLRHSRLSLASKGRARDASDKEWFPLSGPAKAAVKEWLVVRGRNEGPLLTSLCPRTWGAGLSRKGINQIVRAAGIRAGVSPLRPHMFRHAAITRALDRTDGDVRSVQGFSRHAKVETVLIYDDRRNAKTRDIVDLVAEEDDSE